VSPSLLLDFGKADDIELPVKQVKPIDRLDLIGDAFDEIINH